MKGQSTMRRIVLAVALIVGTSGLARAADPVSVQLKWVAQAQFAGYYVAAAKGYYKAAGLDVTIKPGGPDINPSQVIAGGGADVVVDWMPSALAGREKGVDIVNIAQVYQHSGMEFLYMLEGKVVYRHADMRYTMTPGDSLFFDADAPHGPEEMVKLPIHFLSIICYPRGEEG